MSILVGKGQPLLLILSVNTGFLAIFLEGRLSFFRQMSRICLMLVLANPGTRRFRLQAVKVGVFVRWVLMSLRVSSVTLPWFIPDPIFRFLTGSNGLASAWAKTCFRVAFDMLSCSLMFLRGTLAFHNSFFFSTTLQPLSFPPWRSWEPNWQQAVFALPSLTTL